MNNNRSVFLKATGPAGTSLAGASILQHMASTLLMGLVLSPAHGPINRQRYINATGR